MGCWVGHVDSIRPIVHTPGAPEPSFDGNARFKYYQMYECTYTPTTAVSANKQA